MNERIKSLIIAISIGDGHLRKNRGELTVKHCKKQDPYCRQKALLLEDLLKKKINVRDRFYGGFYSVLFSICHPYFKEIRSELYPLGTKRITAEILETLTDEGIAIWYMDDGSLYPKKRNGKVHAFEIVISTCCATQDEALIICDFFNKRYGINMSIKKMKGRFSIRCGTKSCKILINRLSPYQMPSMEYKFKLPE